MAALHDGRSSGLDLYGSPEERERQVHMRVHALVMPHYFFHISNGHPFKDTSGEELPDDNAAWQEALRTVRDIEVNLDLDGANVWSVEVKREDRSIFQIHVSARRTDLDPS
ncbi:MULTISPECIES: DUF6894 family protein [unclassified Bradyrhizobium]